MNCCCFSLRVVTSLTLAIAATSLRAQSLEVPLVPQTVAEHAGLKRAWFAQVPLDQARAKISYVTLQSGALLVVTDESMLHVLDPETGLRQWSFAADERKMVALSAGANKDYVAIANTVQLFVLDRAGGNVVFNPKLTGTPARGPVFTEHNLIVPLMPGVLEAYPLNEDFRKLLGPQYLPSAGRIFGDPAVSDEGLVWSGHFSVLQGHQFSAGGPQFTLPVPGGISTAPAMFAPRVYVGTEAGYLMAYAIVGGDELWRFAAGSPIHHRPIALGHVVYVLPEDGGMFALNPETGEPMWFTADPVRFVAASPTRVYAMDSFHRLAILDAKTGARIDALPVPRLLTPLVNDHSDRIFFYSEDGLLQSLHEPQLGAPQLYTPPKPEAPKKKGPATPAPEATPPAEAAAA
jgi:outer membrane protein assembly factor BamB